MAGLRHHHGHLVSDEKVKIGARDVKFVNLSVDAGTVNGIKLGHLLIVNPALFPERIPIELHEISIWDADDYTQFFNDMVQEASAKTLELYTQSVAITCRLREKLRRYF